MADQTTPDQQQAIELRTAFRQLARLASLSRPYWRDLIQSATAGLIVGAVGLVPPYLTKILIDEVYPSRDASLIPVIVGAVLVLTVTMTTLDAARRYYTQGVTGRLTSAFGLMFFDHVQHQPLSFFTQRQTGDILMRGTELRSALSTLAGSLLQIVTSGVQVILIPPLLLLINWKLACIALAAYPVTAGITLISGAWLRRRWRTSAEAAAGQHAFLLEALTNIKTIKTTALEPAFLGRANDHASQSLRAQMSASGATTIVGLTNSILRALATACFTWYAWTLIVADALSLGDLILFTTYLASLTGPVAQLTGLAGTFQQLAVTVGRVFEILDLSPEQASSRPDIPRVMGEKAPGIEFRSVRFSYSGKRVVLPDLSLAIPAGSVTAIVGQSGSGKSSILHMIVRTASPDHGSVLIDGQPVEGYPLRTLRSMVSVAWQDAELFRGTVRENLLLGCDEGGASRLPEVLRICQLEPVVADLPKGLDTSLSERGVNLSGGQRQRLALARTTLRDSPIVLLDEAMSQVDARMEEEIIGDLLRYLRGRTVVIVTHRMATAAHADQAMVLDAGRVVAAGPPADLQGHVSYRRLMDAAVAAEERQVQMAMGGHA